MTTPLYKGFDDFPPPRFEEDSHRGLWYERFFNQYDDNWQIKKEDKKQEDGKMRWVKNTCSYEKCGDSDTLTQYKQRREQLVKALKGKSQVFQTTWHFVTGLGLAHPVENGFAWHPTLGVPYLAGSAVKGLVRAWLTEWTEVDNTEIEWWLGSEDDKNPRAGQLIFFDAFPIKPVELTADVMTLHMKEWYENGEQIENLQQTDRIPADWHDPNPIPFLAVKQANFLFSIAPRCIERDNLIEPALEVLANALEWLGAGAKTAVGYGHLQLSNQYKRESEEQHQNKKQDQEEKTRLPEEKILHQLHQQFEKAQRKEDKIARSA